MKLRFFATALAVIGAMFFASDAQAFGVKAAQSLYLAPDQTVEGNYYAAGQNLTIDGAITGDLFCVGQNITINGKVGGDVICAGQAININGEVGGDVRTAGNVVNINNKVGKNTMIFAAAAILGSKSEIGGDVLAGAAGLEARGSIAGELYGGGAGVVIDGPVGKNVSMDISCNSAGKKECGSLTIGKNAKIGGYVYYRASPEVKFLNEGTVVGEIKRLEPKQRPVKSGTDHVGAVIVGLWFISRALALVSALILALLLVAIFKDRLSKLSEINLTKVGASFGWGAVLIFLVPIICIFAMATIIAIPIAAALAFIWLALLIIAKVTAAITIGERLFGKFSKSKKQRSMYSVAVFGVIVCYLVFAIPFLGSILSFAALIWALGGIWLYFKQTFFA